VQEFWRFKGSFLVFRRAIAWFGRQSPGLTRATLVLALRVTTLASKLLLAILLASALSPSDVGTYGLVVAVLSMAVVAVGLELYTQTNREIVTASPQHRAELLRDQLVVYLLAYTSAGVLLLSASAIGLLAPELALVLGALIVADHLSQEVFRTLIFLSKLVVANVVLFVRAGAWVLVLPIVWASPEARNIWTVFVLWLGGAAISLLIGLLALRELPWRAAFAAPIDWSSIRKRLRKAVPFIVSAIAALLTLFGDRLFIEVFSGREALGVYTLFFGLAVAVTSIVTSIVSHRHLPRVIAAAQAGRREMEQAVTQFLVGNFAVTVVLSVAAAIAVFPILAIIDKPEYSAATNVYVILLAAMGIRTLSDVPSAALYGMHADRRLLATNLVAAAAAGIGNLLLVPSMGLIGAALAALATSVVLLTAQTLVALLSWKQLGKLAAAEAESTTVPERVTDLIV
jgi:O-antigen/teichoic acid export membrane protein